MVEWVKPSLYFYSNEQVRIPVKSKNILECRYSREVVTQFYSRFYSRFYSILLKRSRYSILLFYSILLKRFYSRDILKRSRYSILLNSLLKLRHSREEHSRMPRNHQFREITSLKKQKTRFESQ